MYCGRAQARISKVTPMDPAKANPKSLKRERMNDHLKYCLWRDKILTKSDWNPIDIWPAFVYLRYFANCGVMQGRT